MKCCRYRCQIHRTCGTGMTQGDYRQATRTLKAGGKFDWSCSRCTIVRNEVHDVLRQPPVDGRRLLLRYNFALLCTTMYTVNNKKRDILFLTITFANLNRINTTCDCSKIYHFALIVCAPYFVNLNNDTFGVSVKTLLFFVHLRRADARAAGRRPRNIKKQLI